jgi:hypothetical protein
LNEKKNPCDIVIECNRRVDDGQEGFQLGLRVHQLHHHDGTPHALLHALQKSGWTVYGSKKKKTTTRMRSSSCSLKPVARKRSKLVLRERLGGLWTVAASAWWWSDRDVCSLFRRASVAVVSLYCGVVESVCVFHFHVMCIRCTCCVLNSDEDEW